MIRATKASIVLALLGICAFALGRPAAAQNLVSNGSFESGTDPGAFHVVNPGDTDIDSWNVTSGSVDYIGTYWVAQDGTRSLDMSGNDAGTLASQSIATTAGQSYLVSFWMAGNPDGGPVVKSMDVSFGAVTNNFLFDNTGKTRNDMGWVLQSFLATATGPSTTLTFESLTPGIFGPTLDNVSVYATPEVGGFGNMAAGLLAPALGMIAVRRRARKSVTNAAA